MVKRKIKKKYSYNERLYYHDHRSNNAFLKATSSTGAEALFRDRKIAYSCGFCDSAKNALQNDRIKKHGGNLKAYEAGIKAQRDAVNKSRNVKF